MRAIDLSMTASVSISASPDMTVLGLCNCHLQTAMDKIAIHMLANGVGLAMAVICARATLPSFCRNCCSVTGGTWVV